MVGQRTEPMKSLKIAKVVLNIGAGRSGEYLERAKSVLEELSGQNACLRNAKESIREWGVHKGEPIGTITTIRDQSKIISLLERLLEAKKLTLRKSCFDPRGNCSFGIQEHIEIEGTKYNPEVGIFGFETSIKLERPGYRVSRRKRGKAKVGKSHLVSRDDTIKFFKEKFGVTVEE
ncbi:MAG: 50S ribosomal protein L5 [Thaumarchaeota archaeon]|nr:50S ribosomal protein L5 [Nitrososphaerota archaeon]